MKGAALTRWVLLGHRWLGMVLGWVVSGIVMLLRRPPPTDGVGTACRPAGDCRR